MMKTLLMAVAVLAAVAVVLAIVTFLLMLLMNLAFPLLPFSYGQAVALIGILVLIGLPALVP